MAAGPGAALLGAEVGPCLTSPGSQLCRGARVPRKLRLLELRFPLSTQARSPGCSERGLSPAGPVSKAAPASAVLWPGSRLDLDSTAPRRVKIQRISRWHPQPFQIPSP